MEENGLFVLRERQVDEYGGEFVRERFFQHPKGRMPLSDVETDARWRAKRRDKRPDLHYQENVIVERGGFIVARKATHASEGDCRPVVKMLEQLPIIPASLAADTGYNDGRLRQHLKELDITAYIPVHPNQEKSMVAKGGFEYRGDHLMCPEGKKLR